MVSLELSFCLVAERYMLQSVEKLRGERTRGPCVFHLFFHSNHLEKKKESSYKILMQKRMKNTLRITKLE